MNAFLLITALAQAQVLTVHEAVNISLSNHPAVAFADAHAARGRHLMREVQATRRPQLSVESNLTYFEEPMIVAPLHELRAVRPPEFDRTLSQSSLSLGYTLFDASRGDRIARADALADAAAAQGDAARAQVIAETVRAYLSVRTTREVAVAQQKQVEALVRERDRARQLVEQGRAARVTLLRAEAALSSSRAEEVSARANLDVAVQELARLLVQPTAAVTSMSLTGVRARDTVRVDRAVLLAQAERTNPELRRLRLQREAADAERNAARGTWWPRVQLGARFIEYASTTTSPQGEWQGGAQLSYPVYTGGARGSAIDRAGAETRAASAELAWGLRRIAESLDRAITALTAVSARVAALQSAVTQSEEVTRIDQLALQAGAGVQTDYLSAEAALFRARAALADARAAEVLAYVEVARVTGALTPEWLATQLENIP